MKTIMASSNPSRLVHFGTLLFVGLLALTLRLIHHGTLLDSPLYSLPLGIPRRFYAEALQILDGALLGGSSLPTENSPLFPYLLALYGYLFGEENMVLVARISNLLFDSGSAVLVCYATMVWGTRAALFAGIIYATSAPLIFFSSGLVSIPVALFLVSLGAALLTRTSHTLLSGLCLGLAATLLPTFLLVALFIALATLSFSRTELKKELKRNFLPLMSGILIGIAPISISNYLRSGSIVLLTPSFGHNFYLAHNPSAEAGYNGQVDGFALPPNGSIFEQMRDYASRINGKSLSEEQVSSFFTKRALQYIFHHPIRELRLLATRALVAISNNEYTTYDNYYFYQERSAVLTYGIPFTPLLILGTLGLWILPLREKKILLTGCLGTYFTLLIFFVISRIRMSAFPFLAIAGGIGADRLIKRQVPLKGILFSLILALLSIYPRPKLNPANEYNKMGWGYERLGRYEEAKRYYDGALALDPSNSDAKNNIERLRRLKAMPVQSLGEK